MTNKEFTMFTKCLKTFYPKENILPSPEAMEMWYRMLSDIDYRSVSVFLQKWVQSEKWPPTVADIRAGCADITTGDVPLWGDAWVKVLKAISRYGYMREDEALSSLDPVTRRAVQALDWKQLCNSENQTADRANFRMVYENLMQKKTDEAKLSPKVKDLIAEMKPVAKPAELESHEEVKSLPEPEKKAVSMPQSVAEVLKTMPGADRPLPKVEKDETYKYVSDEEAARMREDALQRFLLARKRNE